MGRLLKGFFGASTVRYVVNIFHASHSVTRQYLVAKTLERARDEMCALARTFDDVVMVTLYECGTEQNAQRPLAVLKGERLEKCASARGGIAC